MALAFNILARKNASNAALDDLGSEALLLLDGDFGHLAFADLALVFIGDSFLDVSALDLLDSDAALTTSLVLLDETNGRDNLHVEREGVVHDLLDGLRSLVVGARQVSVHDLVNQEFLLLHGLGFGLGLVISRLLLLFLAGLLLFLFLASVTFNLLLEGHLDLDLVVLLEVLGHGDLNNGWVVLQVEEQLIQVHIDALGPGVENAKVLLHFANASHGGLEHSFDEQALLGVHDLVVTVFEFAEDVNVLDVQASQVLEDFVIWPRFNVLSKAIKKKV